MKRRSFLLLAILAAIPAPPANANPFAFFLRAFVGASVRRAAFSGVARGIVSSGFRQLAAGGGRALIRSEISAALRTAASRRVVMHQGQSRMLRLFGNRTRYAIRSVTGEVSGAATVEGDILVFREGARRIGFAQWEREGLVLYRSNGVRMARLVDEGDRVIAYDDEGKYLGQFIREQIDDQLQDIFIDALGNRHNQLVLSDYRPGLTVPEEERHYSHDPKGQKIGFSAIRDGILYVYDAEGVEMARGVMEDGLLNIYDGEGEQQGWFKKSDKEILAFDTNGIQVGRIVMDGENASYFEGGSTQPQAIVNFGSGRQSI